MVKQEITCTVSARRILLSDAGIIDFINKSTRECVVSTKHGSSEGFELLPLRTDSKNILIFDGKTNPVSLSFAFAWTVNGDHRKLTIDFYICPSKKSSTISKLFSTSKSSKPYACGVLNLEPYLREGVFASGAYRESVSLYAPKSKGNEVLAEIGSLSCLLQLTISSDQDSGKKSLMGMRLRRKSSRVDVEPKSKRKGMPGDKPKKPRNGDKNSNPDSVTKTPQSLKSPATAALHPSSSKSVGNRWLDESGSRGEDGMEGDLDSPLDSENAVVPLVLDSEADSDAPGTPSSLQDTPAAGVGGPAVSPALTSASRQASSSTKKAARSELIKDADVDSEASPPQLPWEVVQNRPRRRKTAAEGKVRRGEAGEKLMVSRRQPSPRAPKSPRLRSSRRLRADPSARAASPGALIHHGGISSHRSGYSDFGDVASNPDGVSARDVLHASGRMSATSTTALHSQPGSSVEPGIGAGSSVGPPSGGQASSVLRLRRMASGSARSSVADSEEDPSASGLAGNGDALPASARSGKSAREGAHTPLPVRVAGTPAYGGCPSPPQGATPTAAAAALAALEMSASGPTPSDALDSVEPAKDKAAESDSTATTRNQKERETMCEAVVASHTMAKDSVLKEDATAPPASSVSPAKANDSGDTEADKRPVGVGENSRPTRKDHTPVTVGKSVTSTQDAAHSTDEDVQNIDSSPACPTSVGTIKPGTGEADSQKPSVADELPAAATVADESPSVTIVATPPGQATNSAPSGESHAAADALATGLEDLIVGEEGTPGQKLTGEADGEAEVDEDFLHLTEYTKPVVPGLLEFGILVDNGSDGAGSPVPEDEVDIDSSLRETAEPVPLFPINSSASPAVAQSTAKEVPAKRPTTGGSISVSVPRIQSASRIPVLRSKSPATRPIAPSKKGTTPPTGSPAASPRHGSATQASTGARGSSGLVSGPSRLPRPKTPTSPSLPRDDPAAPKKRLGRDSSHNSALSNTQQPPVRPRIPGGMAAEHGSKAPVAKPSSMRSGEARTYSEASKESPSVPTLFPAKPTLSPTKPGLGRPAASTRSAPSPTQESPGSQNSPTRAARLRGLKSTELSVDRFPAQHSSPPTGYKDSDTSPPRRDGERALLTLAEAMQRLEAEQRARESDAHAHRAMCTQLERRLVEANALTRQANTARVDAEQTAKRAWEELEARKRSFGRSEGDVKAMAAQVEAMEAETLGKNEQIVHLHTSLMESQERVMELERALRDQAERHKTVISGDGSFNQSLRAQLEEKKQEVATLEARVMALTDRLSTSEGFAKSAEATLLRERQAASGTERRLLETKLLEVEERVRAEHSRYLSVFEELRALRVSSRNREADLRDKCAAAEKAAASLQREAETAQADVRKLRVLLAQSEDTCQHVRRDHDAEKQRAASLQKRIDKLLSNDPRRAHCLDRCVQTTLSGVMHDPAIGVDHRSPSRLSGYPSATSHESRSLSPHTPSPHRPHRSPSPGTDPANSVGRADRPTHSPPTAAESEGDGEGYGEEHSSGTPSSRPRSSQWRLKPPKWSADEGSDYGAGAPEGGPSSSAHGSCVPGQRQPTGSPHPLRVDRRPDAGVHEAPDEGKNVPSSTDTQVSTGTNSQPLLGESHDGSSGRLLEEQVSTLSELVRNSESLIEKLEPALKDAEAEVATLREQLKEKEDQVRKYESERDSFAEERKKLVADRSFLDEEIKQLKVDQGIVDAKLGVIKVSDGSGWNHNGDSSSQESPKAHNRNHSLGTATPTTPPDGNRRTSQGAGGASTVPPGGSRMRGGLSPGSPKSVTFASPLRSGPSSAGNTAARASSPSSPRSAVPLPSDPVAVPSTSGRPLQGSVTNAASESRYDPFGVPSGRNHPPYSPATPSPTHSRSPPGSSSPASPLFDPDLSATSPLNLSTSFSTSFLARSPIPPYDAVHPPAFHSPVPQKRRSPIHVHGSPLSGDDRSPENRRNGFNGFSDDANPGIRSFAARTEDMGSPRAVNGGDENWSFDSIHGGFKSSGTSPTPQGGHSSFSARPASHHTPSSPSNTHNNYNHSPAYPPPTYPTSSSYTSPGCRPTEWWSHPNPPPDTRSPSKTRQQTHHHSPARVGGGSSWRSGPYASGSPRPQSSSQPSQPSQSSSLMRVAGSPNRRGGTGPRRAWEDAAAPTGCDSGLHEVVRSQVNSMVDALRQKEAGRSSQPRRRSPQRTREAEIVQKALTSVVRRKQTTSRSFH